MSLSSDSIGKAIKELKKYRKSIDTKAAKLQQRIAENIEKDAQDGFNQAFELYTERSGGRRAVNVKVDHRTEDNIVIVFTSGEDAIWAEFGTGVHFNGDAGSSKHPKGAEKEFYIGMYGKHQGSKDKWGFTGENGSVWTYGMPASLAMYNACEKIYNDYAKIVKEVFE